MASIHRIGFNRSQNDLSRIFKALGHPARIAIIDLLLKKDKLICKELSFEIGLGSPTVTHHLQILMECGLIGYEKIGNMTYYTVIPILFHKAKDALKSLAVTADHQSTNYTNVVLFQQPMPNSF